MNEHQDILTRGRDIPIRVLSDFYRIQNLLMALGVRPVLWGEPGVEGPRRVA